MGAWIETVKPNFLPPIASSHPTWVRGLKLYLFQWSACDHSVAPYVGAWIETIKLHYMDVIISVAPYVGAWIETRRNNSRSERNAESHPTWVRGLKPPCSYGRIRPPFVAPYVGAWIETAPSPANSASTMSHPTWVRGLKLLPKVILLMMIPSHPTWVRGLKHSS